MPSGEGGFAPPRPVCQSNGFANRKSMPRNHHIEQWVTLKSTIINPFPCPTEASKPLPNWPKSWPLGRRSPRRSRRGFWRWSRPRRFVDNSRRSERRGGLAGYRFPVVPSFPPGGLRGACPCEPPGQEMDYWSLTHHNIRSTVARVREWGGRVAHEGRHGSATSKGQGSAFTPHPRLRPIRGRLGQPESAAMARGGQRSAR